MDIAGPNKVWVVWGDSKVEGDVDNWTVQHEHEYTFDISVESELGELKAFVDFAESIYGYVAAGSSCDFPEESGMSEDFSIRELLGRTDDMNPLDRGNVF